MYLLLVDFPDETLGTDHIHIWLGDREAVVEYLEWFRIAIGNHRYEVARQRVCPRCHYYRR